MALILPTSPGQHPRPHEDLRDVRHEHGRLTTPVLRRSLPGGLRRHARDAVLRLRRRVIVTDVAGRRHGLARSPSWPAGSRRSRVQVTVAGSALADVGGAVLVESTAGVFLLARTSESTFSAVEAVCTHEGCTITGADGATYVCPCHGSRYNRSGQVLAGPARASLRQYATTFTDGVVTIAL